MLCKEDLIFGLHKYMQTAETEWNHLGSAGSSDGAEVDVLSCGGAGSGRDADDCGAEPATAAPPAALCVMAASATNF